MMPQMSVSTDQRVGPTFTRCLEHHAVIPETRSLGFHYYLPACHPKYVHLPKQDQTTGATDALYHIGYSRSGRSYQAHYNARIGSDTRCCLT